MFTIAVNRPNESAIELTPVVDSVRFSTAAVGGFGACSFRLGLDEAARVPHLGRVRLYHGSRMLWEGRVEDKALSIKGAEASVTVNCFGYARLLEETSIRRLWTLRTIAWRPSVYITSLQNCGSALTLRTDTVGAVFGQFKIDDLTRVGANFSHTQGGTPAAGHANWGVYLAPENTTLKTMILRMSGSNNASLRMFVQDSVAGSGFGENWNSIYCQVPAAYPQPETTLTLTPGARGVVIGVNMGVSISNLIFEDIRILGTELAEDTPGAYYGGTILRDLIKLVPGLQAGIIERGTEFAIQACSRLVRDSAMSVVQEISAFYDREWAVWEDRRFDWKAVDTNSPDWIIPLSAIGDLDLTSSTDGMTRKTYLIYQNAVTGEVEEKSATSTERVNPYVRADDTLDSLVQAPAVMTSASGQRLANRIITDRGGAPIARGRVSLPTHAMIRGVDRGPAPAMFLRGGDNVVIPDAPTDNYFRPTPGADGATMFHVRSTEVDMQTGMMTLELDAFTHRSDILMARVAAVTRTFSGS